MRVSFAFIFLHQKIFNTTCVCFLLRVKTFFSSVLLCHFPSVLTVFPCYFAAGSYLTLIEYVHVKITIIFTYSNYNVMLASTSTVTVCYILNIHDTSNVDPDYLPLRLVATDGNSSMFALKHVGL